LSTPLSAEKQAAAERKLAELEAHRQKQMQEYAIEKAALAKGIP
jgi:hypothetical protein